MDVIRYSAAANHAIGDAFKIMQRGDADVMLAGGTEAVITPLAVAAFGNIKAVSATKSMTGHLLGVAGGIAVICTAFALYYGILPPTLHLEHPDPLCDLDYVPHVARYHKMQLALSNAFGFGGTNAVLGFKA